LPLPRCYTFAKVARAWGFEDGGSRIEAGGLGIGDRGSNAAPISSQCLCRLCEISAAHVENVFAALLLLPLFVVLLLSARQRFVYGIGGHWSAIGCRLSLKSLHSDRRAAIK